MTLRSKRCDGLDRDVRSGMEAKTGLTNSIFLIVSRDREPSDGTDSIAQR